MFFLTPRYLKHAKLTLRGVARFLNYKKDLLPEAKLAEINALRHEFKGAIRHRDRERINDLTAKLNQVCEHALPDTRASWLTDNIEVIFVAIVIALGIRAYVATLFQIPTGSMQPTLNGITAEATAEDPDPGFFGRMLGMVTGERFINVVSDRDGELRYDNPSTREDETLSEHRYLIFMPYCRLHFQDGGSIKIGCPKRQLLEELQMAHRLQAQVREIGKDTPDLRSDFALVGGAKVRKGQVLARGVVRNGDQVIVNKMAYHFLPPKRGEVFVFTTQNIRDISVPAEQGSQHYIKRLAGLPGDTLSVRPPELFINGKLAEEPGFRRVMQGTFQNPVNGYRGYASAGAVNGRYNDIELRDDRYFALGDNSYNSSDSRVWGTVPERNLVGPALWCYWPLNKHWGPIR